MVKRQNRGCMNKSGYAVTVPPAYTGVVFLFCWTYLMFYASSAGIEAAAPISLYSASYTISALVMVATLLVLSFARVDRVRILVGTRIKVIVGVGLSIGAVAPGQAALGSSETTAHIPAAPDPSEVATRICDAHGLSAREKDVFTLLAKGYTSPRIQKELYIAAGTVNYHTRNIYAKLGVHTKQELIGMYEAELNR